MLLLQASALLVSPLGLRALLLELNSVEIFGTLLSRLLSRAHVVPSLCVLLLRRRVYDSCLCLDLHLRNSLPSLQSLLLYPVVCTNKVFKMSLHLHRYRLKLNKLPNFHGFIPRRQDPCNASIVCILSFLCVCNVCVMCVCNVCV